jgi:hypothetical protein
MDPKITKYELKIDTIKPQMQSVIVDTTDYTTIEPSLIFPNDTSHKISNSGYLSEISVFPNPTEDKFTVQINSVESGNINLKLFSDELQLLWKMETEITQESHSFQVDISGFAKGSYFLMIESNRKKWVKKIVKM